MQNQPTFKNTSELIFDDISTEVRRTYVFPTGKVTIEAPVYLNVSKSGGHRLWTADGISHYIPAGWIHLYWETKNGSSHFVK